MKCTQHTAATFRVEEIKGHRSIVFKPCGVRSFHPRDIAEHFCARCGRWIEPAPQSDYEKAAAKLFGVSR